MNKYIKTDVPPSDASPNMPAYLRVARRGVIMLPDMHYMLLLVMTGSRISRKI